MLCVLEPGNEEALRGLVSVFLFGLLIWASNFYGRPHLQLETLQRWKFHSGYVVSLRHYISYSPEG